jgi:hypothetical protein
VNVNVRVIAYCALGGAPLLIGALGTGDWPEWWLAGIVLAMGFVPVALFGPRSLAGQFGAVSLALLIITALCTWSEALIFVPTPEFRQHPFQLLIGPCVMYLVVAAVLAALGVVMRLNRETGLKADHRGLAGAVMMTLLCGLAYVVYYTIFGTITYQFFTRGYYPDATRVVANLGLWFWAIQFARGSLMTVAVVPIIYTLRMRRRHTAVVVGMLIWIAGGLAPLLIPNPYMSPNQRLIHIVEIFTQNLPLGVTAALLLRR